MRPNLLRKFDLWSHRGFSWGRPQSRLDRLLCDAWEYHVSCGEVGRRLWPLTKWRYKPWSDERAVYFYSQGEDRYLFEGDQPSSHL